MKRQKANPALTGIETRHKKACRSLTGGACSCKPSYRAEVHDPETGRPKKSPSFRTVAEAKGWKARADLALRTGTFSSGATFTVREAADDWLLKAEAGEVLNKSGKTYKPSVLRSYESSLRLHVLPLIGARRLTKLRRSDVQNLVDQNALTKAPSTVRNAIMPLRAIYRWALVRSLVDVNPTEGITLPAVESVRDRVATPEEAADLLAALPIPDRAVWATALYAGLRLGELQALEWDEIDLHHGVIRVRWSWDKKVGRVPPKSRAGKRRVPIPQALAEVLEEHRDRHGAPGGLVFGRTETKPFSDSAVRNRARRLWLAAGIAPIGFHESRHTYASLMIAAGVGPKALSSYMGHSSITTTFDRYGHLFPGSEGEAAALLDALLVGE